MSSPGYTDEVAEECHDLIDRAEEEAHVRSYFHILITLAPSLTHSLIPGH